MLLLFLCYFLILKSNEKSNEIERKMKFERLQNMAEEKELRKMNRTELIEIIYALKKEEEVNHTLEEAEQERKHKWDAFEKKCGAYMRQHQELTTLLQSLEAYTGGNA